MTGYPACETCGKTNHSTGKCYFGAKAAHRPPEQRTGKTETGPTTRQSEQFK